MPDYNIPMSSGPQGAAAGLDTSAPRNPMGAQIPMNVQPFAPIDVNKDITQAYKNAETAGEYEANQQQRMQQMQQVDTTQRDTALLKAWQGSGHQLYSAEDLTLAVHELGDKLSPDAAQRLGERLDAAKLKEAKFEELSAKMPIEQMQALKDTSDFMVERLRSVQNAYDAALKADPSPAGKQKAMQAFEAAKQANIQAASAEKNPIDPTKPLFSPEKLQELSGLTPDALPHALEQTKYGQDLASSALARRLTEAKVDQANATVGKTEAQTANTEKKTSQMDEELKLKQDRAEAAIKKANNTGQFDPKDADSAAQMIASYNMAPISGYAMRSPFGQKVMAQVRELNPEYDATGYAKKQKTVNDFATGQDGKTVRAFNTAVNHLDTLDKLITALGNNDVKAINQLTNVFKTQFGVAPPTEFDAAKQLVAGEITKAITNGNGGVTEREHLQDMLSKANSPDVLHSVVGDYRGFMADQIKSLRQQYESGSSGGTKGFDSLLLDTSKEVEKSGPHAGPTNFPKVTPEVQGGLDAGRKEILESELIDKQKVLETAKTPEDKHRAEEDVKALQRELGSTKGAKKPIVSQDMDAKALKWAKEHPENPDAKAILELHNGG